jgi:hypothetical protein
VTHACQCNKVAVPCPEWWEWEGPEQVCE